MDIRRDDLSGQDIAAFLEEHIMEMRAVSPPESKHALDLEGLKKPGVTFWSVWQSEHLVGCGALQELTSVHGEIKSMRTSPLHRGKGVASSLLHHIIEEAKLRRYSRLSLETGSMPYFQAARALYGKFGFTTCSPFSNYREDPNSVFMTLEMEISS